MLSACGGFAALICGVDADFISGARPNSRVDVMIPVGERVAVLNFRIGRWQHAGGVGPECICRVVTGPAVADGAVPSIREVTGRVMNAPKMIENYIARCGVEMYDVVFLAFSLDVWE